MRSSGQKNKILAADIRFQIRTFFAIFSSKQVALKKIVKIHIICIGLVHNNMKIIKIGDKKVVNMFVSVPGKNRTDDPLIARQTRELSKKFC